MQTNRTTTFNDIPSSALHTISSHLRVTNAAALSAATKASRASIDLKNKKHQQRYAVYSPIYVFINNSKLVYGMSNRDHEGTWTYIVDGGRRTMENDLLPNVYDDDAPTTSDIHYTLVEPQTSHLLKHAIEHMKRMLAVNQVVPTSRIGHMRSEQEPSSTSKIRLMIDIAEKQVASMRNKERGRVSR